jgi:hypothetical protein
LGDTGIINLAQNKVVSYATRDTKDVMCFSSNCPSQFAKPNKPHKPNKPCHATAHTQQINERKGVLKNNSKKKKKS